MNTMTHAEVAELVRKKKALKDASGSMLKALYAALFAMGELGANHDLNHPCRKAWEQVSEAIAKAEGK